MPAQQNTGIWPTGQYAIGKNLPYDQVHRLLMQRFMEENGRPADGNELVVLENALLNVDLADAIPHPLAFGLVSNSDGAEMRRRYGITQEPQRTEPHHTYGMMDGADGDRALAIQLWVDHAYTIAMSSMSPSDLEYWRAHHTKYNERRNDGVFDLQLGQTMQPPMPESADYALPQLVSVAGSDKQGGVVVPSRDMPSNFSVTMGDHTTKRRPLLPSTWSF